jgi:ubiquinone/menaquinone biosynthesis C-methylase UbiE
MSKITELIDRFFYPDFQDNWDDLLFRERIESKLNSNSVILDVGAGAGIVEAMNFRGKVSRVCGIDLDPRVLANDKLDEGNIANAGEIPFADETFDVVFADNVMEHLDDPRTVFGEINRVLKPGGALLFKTPNRSHYMPLIARWTPHGFHQFVNRVRGRDAEDTFPTLYLANSERQVKEIATVSGFEVARIEFVEGRPEYLRMFPVTYLLGVLYERLVNASEAFSRFRILLIAELRKPV